MEKSAFDKKPDDSDQWTLSYGDMVTLVLTFFIMLFAISKIDMEKMEVVAKSMSEAMDKDRVRVISVERIVKDVNDFVAQENLQEAVDVQVTPRGVAVNAKGGVLVPSGSAELGGEAFKILSHLATVINSVKYNIAVEGHTDDVPISGGLASLYPTNWELSSARASSVVRYFIENGVPPNRLSAVGYADTRPIKPNDSEANRSENRRVAVVFLVF
jgi:chemotaxis protein MotB